MRKLAREKRAMVLTCLVEGMSVNSTARTPGCSKVTVLRLLADAGALCADDHNLHVRRLLAARVEADELWSFCGCKAATNAAGGIGHRLPACLNVGAGQRLARRRVTPPRVTSSIAHRSHSNG